MSDSGKSFLQRWVVTTLGVILAASVVSGIHANSIVATLGASLLLGILNAVLRPVLMVFALPLLVLTLGLFTFVINALLLYLVAHVVKGFYVQDFWAAFKGSLVISIVSFFANMTFGAKRVNSRSPSPAPAPPPVQNRPNPPPDTGSGPIIDV